jgi:hypothetical protein
MFRKYEEAVLIGLGFESSSYYHQRFPGCHCMKIITISKHSLNLAFIQISYNSHWKIAHFIKEAHVTQTIILDRGSDRVNSCRVGVLLLPKNIFHSTGSK